MSSKWTKFAKDFSPKKSLPIGTPKHPLMSRSHQHFIRKLRKLCETISFCRCRNMLFIKHHCSKSTTPIEQKRYMEKKRLSWQQQINKHNKKKITGKETIEEATCATIKLHEADTVVPFKIKAGDKQRACDRQSKTVEQVPQSQRRRN
jgi:hypothetical protein